MKAGKLEDIRPSLKLSIGIQKFRVIFMWHWTKNLVQRKIFRILTIMEKR